jgi:hypothetical protein
MLRYVGKGFLRGVPARDLREDEVARYGYSYLVRSGLYVPEKQEAIKPPDIVEEMPAPKKRRTKKESKSWLE